MLSRRIVLMRSLKGIRLSYRSDQELEAIHRRDSHKRDNYYRMRKVAKKTCEYLCKWVPGLGLIPEAGCPIHDKPYVKAGEYIPHG